MAIDNFVNKFGYNADVDATVTSEDIISVGGDVYLPSDAVSAANINITSSDSNDTSAGTGAQKIQIYGLDADYLEQTEVVTLSGLSNVNPVNDYTRIFRARVTAAGSGNTAAGIITIADATGTFCEIPLTHNQTLHAAYTVPAKFPFSMMHQFYASIVGVVTSTWVVLAIQVREFGGVWQTKDLVNVTNSSPADISYTRQSFLIPSKADMRIRAVDASASNLRVSARFTLEHIRGGQ